MASLSYLTSERSECNYKPGIPNDSVMTRCRPPEQMATEHLIRAKLKEVMMSENLDEVTSKYVS